MRVVGLWVNHSSLANAYLSAVSFQHDCRYSPSVTKHSCTHNMSLADQLLAEGFVGGEKLAVDLADWLDQHEIEYVHELAGA